MFTLSQIQEAHKKVKTGSDFPLYAQEITDFGVTGYDTFVADGHSVYFGNPEPTLSLPKYDPLDIAKVPDSSYFIERLRLHQQGGTDYKTFCEDCARSGIEKWTLDMLARTCTYYDINGNEILIERFPS